MLPRVRTSYNGEKLISNKMSLSEVTTMAIRNGKWSLCFCIGVGYGGSGLDTDGTWKAASDNAAAFVPTAGPGHPCHRLIWGPGPGHYGPVSLYHLGPCSQWTLRHFSLTQKGPEALDTETLGALVSTLSGARCMDTETLRALFSSSYGDLYPGQ